MTITGIDLSPKMVAIANETHTRQNDGSVEMKAEVGDASEIHLSGGSDLLFSSFGLQQMGSTAPQALANWFQCLKGGGLLIVLLWPSWVEEQGPWMAYQSTVEEFNGAGSSARRQEEWEVNLLSEASKVDGIDILSDTEVKHEMSWQDADECWRVMTEGGPWSARRLRYGEGHMADLKSIWQGRLSAHSGPLLHYPCARQILIRKRDCTRIILKL